MIDGDYCRATNPDRGPSATEKFTWFTPAAKHPTDYENLTVGQYSSPGPGPSGCMSDGPCHFDDGRDPFTEDSNQGFGSSRLGVIGANPFQGLAATLRTEH